MTETIWLRHYQEVNSRFFESQEAGPSPEYSDLFVWNFDYSRTRIGNMISYLLLFGAIGITKDQRDTVRESWLRRIEPLLENQALKEETRNKLRLIFDLIFEWPDFHVVFQKLEDRLPHELYGNYLPIAKRIRFRSFSNFPKPDTRKIKRPQRKRGYSDKGTYHWIHEEHGIPPSGEKRESKDFGIATTLDYLEKDYPELNQKVTELQQDYLLRSMGESTDRVTNNLLEVLSSLRDQLAGNIFGTEEENQSLREKIQKLEQKLDSRSPEWRNKDYSPTPKTQNTIKKLNLF